MHRQQFIILVVVSALLSLVGGLIGGGLVRPHTALAQAGPAEEKRGPEVVASVQAREFVLVDAKGGKRAELSVTDAGDTNFALFDGNAREKFAINCTDEKLMLQVKGQGQQPVFMLATADSAKDRAVMFSLLGVNDLPVLWVQHRGHREAEKKRLEETYLGIGDGKNPRLMLGHNGADRTLFGFMDKDENFTVSLASSKEEGQLLQLVDVPGESNSILMAGQGTASVRLASPGYYAQGAANNDAAIWQLAKDKVIRMVAGISGDGAPRIIGRDSKGKETWRTDAKK